MGQIAHWHGVRHSACVLGGVRNDGPAATVVTFKVLGAHPPMPTSGAGTKASAAPMDACIASLR